MVSLNNAIKKAVLQFGADILTDRRFLNILSDFGAFKSVPATKTIMKNMIENGYCKKIYDLGKKKKLFPFFSKGSFEIEKPEGNEWKVKITSLTTSISKQNGFEEVLVVYVVDCIIYGLGWSDKEPEEIQIYKQSQPQMKKADNYVESKHSHPNLSSSSTGSNMSDAISYEKIEESQFIVLNVKPSNAEVFIDGIQQSVYNGVMATELKVGEHDYEVKAESYKKQSGTFEISADEKTVLDIQLELDNNTLKLHIQAEDTDAEIWVNGKCCGIGNWVGLYNKDTIEVECIKPRFYPYKHSRKFGANKNEFIHIPALKPICGNIKVNVQPYGSEIFINGENQGTTPLLVTNVQIGERTIRVKSSEGSEYYGTVDVKEGQVTTINHIIPSLFIYDYSKVRIGDFFYEDGTFSHEKANGKKVVGIVFSLETSEEEKKYGWTHGQIVALNDAQWTGTKMSSWGIPSNEILQYAVLNPVQCFSSQEKGYEISHLESVINNEEYAPFYIASQYSAKLPHGTSSGWYLPSIIQWKTLYENTHYDWETLWKYLKLIEIGGLKNFATASILDNKQAWTFTMGYAENFKHNAYSAKDIRSSWRTISVRSVAAF